MNKRHLKNGWRRVDRYTVEYASTAEYRDDDDAPFRVIPVRATVEQDVHGDRSMFYKLRVYGDVDGDEVELYVERCGQHSGIGGQFSRLYEAKDCAVENIKRGFVGHES